MEQHTNELEIIRLAMEFVLANRRNVKLLQNSEYRELSDVCERELTRRANRVYCVECGAETELDCICDELNFDQQEVA